MTLPTERARRVLVHLDDGRRVPLEPEEIFLLEAHGDETELRTRGRRRLRDVRALGQVLARLPPGTFVQIHRSIAVNVDRVSEMRRRPNGRDWELRHRLREDAKSPVVTLVAGPGVARVGCAVGRNRLAGVVDVLPEADAGRPPAAVGGIDHQSWMDEGAGATARRPNGRGIPTSRDGCAFVDPWLVGLPAARKGIR